MDKGSGLGAERFAVGDTVRYRRFGGGDKGELRLLATAEKSNFDLRVFTDFVDNELCPFPDDERIFCL